MSKVVRLLEQLSDIPGVSGWEEPVREKILSLVKEHCDSWQVDPLGNLLVFKKGEQRPKNRLMLSAHMDEVGFIITHIEKEGLLRFGAVGGIDSRVVTGKSVEVGRDRLFGVIGSKAVHISSSKEKEEPLELEKLFIDIGTSSQEEAEKLVSPGDRAIFHAPFLRLGEHGLSGRAFDNRAGCALMIELIRSQLPYDCHFAFTVQEENGCVGGVTAGYAINPDISLVLETTTAADIPGVSKERQVCRLGKGPVLSFMDRGTVYHPDIFQLAMDTAKAEGIPCQTKSLVAGGNEARAIQTAGAGVRMLAVNLPCRYLHSPSNMLHKKDIGEAYKLLQALIARLGNHRE